MLHKTSNSACCSFHACTFTRLQKLYRADAGSRLFFESAAAARHVTMAATETAERETIQELVRQVSESPELHTCSPAEDGQINEEKRYLEPGRPHSAGW